MNWFQSHCAILEPPDTILHIGAGSGGEIDAYRQFPEARVALVEPQAEQARHLRHRTTGSHHFQVLELAVTSSSGEAPLKQFNFPEFSSMAEPVGLLELLPGIVVTAQQEVSTVTISDLVETLGLNPGDDNWLVIDAPGSEALLVAAITKSDLKGTFKRVFLRAGAESMYKGGSPYRELAASLGDSGYVAIGPADKGDPDWPCRHFQYEKRVAASQELTATVERLQSEIKVLEDASESAGLEISRLTNALGASNHEFEQRLQKESTRASELESELEKSRADLSVALRLQAKREADLRDLQQRYEEVVRLKNEQHELLAKLGGRLGAAARYLKELQGLDEAADSRDATAGLVKALTGDVEPVP